MTATREELLGVLVIVFIFSLFFIAGLFIFIGAVKKWRCLMEPFTPSPPLVYAPSTIKKYFGPDGLRTFWFVLSLCWMLGAAAVITLEVKKLYRAPEDSSYIHQTYGLEGQETPIGFQQLFRNFTNEYLLE